MASFPKRTHAMISLPEEMKRIIVHLLPDNSDRNALLAVFPTWKDIIMHEDSLRKMTVGTHQAHDCLSPEEFLEEFAGLKVRRRQFLEEVEADFQLEFGRGKIGCCQGARPDYSLEDDDFADQVQGLLHALQNIAERVQSHGAPLTPMRLAFHTCGHGGWGAPLECRSERKHSKEDALVRELCRDHFYLHLDDDVVPEVKGVHEFVFRNHDTLLFLHPSFLTPMVKRLVDVRRIRLNFEEEVQWPRDLKADWKNDIATAVWRMPIAPRLEEFHLHIGHRSPRNELLKLPERVNQFHCTGQMLQNLSFFPSLTVLRLTGQLVISGTFFNGIIGNPDSFPALTKFHLDFAPDTADENWFFVEDETDEVWEKALQNPDTAYYVRLANIGMLPTTLQPEWEGPTEEDDGYWEYMAEKERTENWAFLTPDEIKRNRTLPNDLTLNPLLRAAAGAVAVMRKIDEFSICLADKFGLEEKPFTPSFLTRVFELHFVKSPEGKSGPTLTWKLGQKVDYWRPADDVLDAWKAAAGDELEVSFVE